jgi:restriction system-associated AAA family ATPase
MKLLRLKLDVPFRSLAAGFEVHFLREWDFERYAEFLPYCLAGRNGSGKSDLLEALAAIFFHVECMYLDFLPERFAFEAAANPKGFRAEVCTPDAFELEYFFRSSEWTDIAFSATDDAGATTQATQDLPPRILIRKKAGQRPEIHWLNRAEFEPEKPTLLNRAEVKEFLPKYILGYSSGHNEILSLPFFKMRFIHFDEYCHYLRTDDKYGERPEGRMIYLDEQFSQAILICHFMFPSEPILKVFKEKVGLTGIRSFRIIIRKHHRIQRVEDQRIASSPDSIGPTTTNTVELTNKLSTTIARLKGCATTYYEDYESSEAEDSCDLYLDYWVNDATRRAFAVHFGESVAGTVDASKAASALNLFQSLQMLLTLNHYQVDDQTKIELYQSDSLYVNETIPMPASHERITRFKEGELIKEGVTNTLYVKALSDGEHQLLHTIGLCLLFRHEPALFLLDEPETHLNPDWRASYISTLRQALEADGGTRHVMREVLLTSHSPFIISDCQQENVLVFNKDAETKAVTCKRPDFNTFGASVNAITIKVFGQRETIGDFALSKLDGFRARLREGDDPDELIREASDVLGDSVERVLFINEAIKRLSRG